MMGHRGRHKVAEISTPLNVELLSGDNFVRLKLFRFGFETPAPMS